MEFGGGTNERGSILQPVSHTIFEDEKVAEDEESMWGMNESNSNNSVLPKHRTKHRKKIF